ncbi:MAG: sigma 54-interacting transcriptional regulator [Bradymonadia bacterium]
MSFHADFGDDAALKTIFVGNRPAAKRLRKSKLVVLEGPDVGRELVVAREVVIVGRTAVCDLELTDKSVSSRHFSISAVDNGYVLRDEGSTNGTFYGDVKIREIFLRPGTVFRAGNTVLKFQPTDDLVTIELSAQDRFDSLLGQSIAMREVFATLERVAPSELTVLIQGETGTGKEMVARAIHNHSPRRAKPYVVLDCSSIPKDLIESTLFGHEKGSFTGAVGQHRGVFEQANGGTIFLDEIGELDLNLQPKLLRVLENREVKRVGGDRTFGVDVRVVAATNRDLRKMVTDGTFREDLYFRMSVVAFELPPLRRRRDDVPLLVGHFLEKFNEGRRELGRPGLEVSPEAMSGLLERPWNGNIRELKNVVERAASLGDGPVLTRRDFMLDGSNYGLVHVPTPQPVVAAPVSAPAAPAASSVGAPAAGPAPAPAPGPAVDLQNTVVFPVDITAEFKDAKQALGDAFEAIYLRKLVLANKGNISQCAKVAGLTRFHLRELLKKHEIKARE